MHISSGILNFIVSVERPIQRVIHDVCSKKIYFLSSKKQLLRQKSFYFTINYILYHCVIMDRLEPTPKFLSPIPYISLHAPSGCRQVQYSTDQNLLFYCRFCIHNSTSDYPWDHSCHAQPLPQQIPFGKIKWNCPHLLSFLIYINCRGASFKEKFNSFDHRAIGCKRKH